MRRGWLCCNVEGGNTRVVVFEGVDIDCFLVGAGVFVCFGFVKGLLLVCDLLVCDINVCSMLVL